MKDNKISRTFRLSKNTIGILEVYAKKEGISNTETVERAIKKLCREHHQPATKEDLLKISEFLNKGQQDIMDAIKTAPIPALPAQEKRSLFSRLFG